ncbi:hypothetical protein [Nonomuraea sp. NPDC003804]|uniref:hypothetical protein n=1 Tax=Nonomuraea sp. NPDC003804 TaxID=3154547 RepID=UPI0033A5DD01
MVGHARSAELDRLLAAEPMDLTPVIRTPFDQAALETTARYRGFCDRSLEYWRGVLTTARPAMFPTRRFDSTDSFYMVKFAFPGMGDAVHQMSEELGVPSTAVFLASAVSALGKVLAIPRVTIEVTSGNRFTQADRSYVGSLTQRGVLSVDVCGGSFASIVQAAHRGLYMAYRHARYDPVSLARVVSEVARARETSLDLSCAFNDVRLAPESRRRGNGESPQPATTRDDARRIEWTGPLSTQENMKFYVRIGGDAYRPVVELTVDTRYVSREVVMDFFSAMEELLTAT